jgi:hypothetical protein
MLTLAIRDIHELEQRYRELEAKSSKSEGGSKYGAKRTSLAHPSEEDAVHTSGEPQTPSTVHHGGGFKSVFICANGQ